MDGIHAGHIGHYILGMVPAHCHRGHGLVGHVDLGGDGTDRLRAVLQPGPVRAYKEPDDAAGSDAEEDK